MPENQGAEGGASHGIRPIGLIELADFYTVRKEHGDGGSGKYRGGRKEKTEADVNHSSPKGIAGIFCDEYGQKLSISSGSKAGQ